MEPDARTEEVELFAKILHHAIGGNHERITRFNPSLEVVGFLPVEGRAYSGELMVVGRAVNGWKTCLHPPQKFADEAFARQYAEGVLSVSRSEEKDCPMKSMLDEWQGEKKRIPPFFAATREITKRLGIANDIKNNDWASQLLWSQLYKLSPARGNPTGELAYRQRCETYNCVDLLKVEIKRCRPKRLLFLTGWKDWARNFIDNLNERTGGYIEALGNLQSENHQTRVVVACRPEGRRLQDFAEQVAEAFGD
jgi:hypothetical protein